MKTIVPLSECPEWFTVLVVEDDENVRDALMDFLRSMNVRILQAAGGTNEAGAILNGIRPHLVISDFDLPDGNGAGFLDRVAVSHPETRRLLMSGRDRTESETRGHAFMAKPSLFQDLRPFIMDVVADVVDCRAG